uniref:Uncharacterized protein n=1 Tax=Desulfovibrio desulfuricans (strain ATCC 27774 / DSM 6949 / MB) TaxID=525146 RepID=B8J060_DESDA
MVRFFVITGLGLALVNGWMIWWLWRALPHTGWLRPLLSLFLFFNFWITRSG